MPTRRCTECKNRIHPQDPHEVCLKCLSPSHPSDTCGECLSLPLSVRVTRQDIVSRALARGSWPSDWRTLLVQRESQIYADNIETSVKEDDRGETRKKDDSDPEQLVIEESGSQIQSTNGLPAYLPISAVRSR